METKIYYVAKTYGSLMPLIVERFNNAVDADSYATLMSNAKKCNYIVLEQKLEYIGDIELIKN